MNQFDQPGSKCIRETVPAGGTQDQILSARELENQGYNSCRSGTGTSFTARELERQEYSLCRDGDPGTNAMNQMGWIWAWK
jgi:hypothetical protein